MIKVRVLAHTYIQFDVFAKSPQFKQSGFRFILVKSPEQLRGLNKSTIVVKLEGCYTVTKGQDIEAYEQIIHQRDFKVHSSFTFKEEMVQ